MTYSVQIAIDSEQPHDLADWWAQTLGWIVEPSDEAFIRSMIDQGYATDDQTMTHNGVLVWTAGAAINPPAELAAAPRILFQLVPEVKSVKNRVHLDLRSADAPTDAEHAALVLRGARKLHEGNQGPHRWVTYADPEGNEFCL
ncbi:MAG: VOC family protein [Antricoccus sp.]